VGEEVVAGDAADRGGGGAGEVGGLGDDFVGVGAGPGGYGGEGAEVFGVAEGRRMVVEEQRGRAEGGPRDAQRRGGGGLDRAVETGAGEAGAGEGGETVALREGHIAALPPFFARGIGERTVSLEDQIEAIPGGFVVKRTSGDFEEKLGAGGWCDRGIPAKLASEMLDGEVEKEDGGGREVGVAGADGDREGEGNFEA
jgi:hypothetical protein